MIILLQQNLIIVMSSIRLFFIILFISSSLHAQIIDSDLKLAKDFPIWIKLDSTRANQTSGIAFLYDKCGEKYFLLADDIGTIHLLVLKENIITRLDQIDITGFFNEYPKLDFEEIVYDRQTGSVFLSIEGNGPDSKSLNNIFKLFFKDDNILTCKVDSIKKINFTPEELYRKYIQYNIGYEGFAVDQKYFYLGLENLFGNFQFVDSTVIFIANKSDLSIIKELNTKNYNVHTICGLFSDSDLSLWGIDRNNRKIFHFLFDEGLNVKNFSSYDCSLQIPGYENLNYLPSLESITMDDEQNIYLVDDPWREVFIPPDEILTQLDKETINNFRNFTPIIYKYKLKYIKGDD